jgi:iron complex outermembrane receptor protein
VLFFNGVPSPASANTLLIHTPSQRTAEYVEKSLFANLTAHIGDKTEISGGIRRIRLHSLSNFTSSAFATPPAEDRELKANIYEASLKHRFNDHIMAYGSFGTSWRPGSNTNTVILFFAGLATPNSTVASLYLPEAETSKSYEIGIKTDWLDRRLRFNLTAYHQTFDNFAFSSQAVFVGGANSAGQNSVFTAAPSLAVGVPAKVDGIEAELQFHASERLDLSLLAAYAKSKISNGNIPCNDYFLPNGILGADGISDPIPKLPTYDQLASVTGGKLVQFCKVNLDASTSAPFSATATISYNHSISEKLEGYVRGLAIFNGKSKANAINEFDDVDANTHVNFYAGIRAADGSWEIGGFAKNVFNSQQVIGRSSTPITASYRSLAAAINFTTAYRGLTSYGPEREFGVTVRAAFGSR